ncbi:hypothetical protein KEM56_000347 [Ascosphaera pollenicola]|nr:hypothetical protein KEM56_000347 [Ascosphaera pollenicola]
MSTIFRPNSVVGYEPYWGEPTSHMNFCENDYEFSPYFGEFINTVTSFAYVAFGAYPLFRQWGAGSKSSWHHSLSYISLIIVGIGSALFHMTMKYELQLVDDLSMLLGASTMLHLVLTLDDSWQKKLYVFVGIFTALSASVWAHVYTGDSTLHQIVFGSMVFTTGYKLVKLNKMHIKDSQLQQKLLDLMTFAICVLTVAYITWCFDTIICDALRRNRAYLGLPWAWLLELHGWWHLLTALGVYIAMVEAEYLYAVNRGMTADPEISYIRILMGPNSRSNHSKKE